ncbi:MAG: electron transport complex subunit RsxC [Eubacteriales bacterium]
MEKKKITIPNATLHRQKGGINVPHYKNTVCCETIEMPSPDRVTMPVRQHIGAPCEPVVAKGDLVKVGQKIADSSAFVSTPIHASVSGKVVAIEDVMMPGSGNVPSIIIESDGKMEVFEGVKPIPIPKTIKELCQAIRESGLVGLGGAGFPAHVKLLPQEGKRIDTLIINFAECEPYVCSDYRLSIEETKDIFEGIDILQSLLHIPNVYICVEDNKPEAIKALQAAAKDEKFVSARDVRLAVLTSKYPKGAEKVLINIVTGRQVPTGKLPSDVGALVMNLSSIAFIAKYFKTGMPLISKRITVDGSALKNPSILKVPIGTKIKDVIEFCGGYSKTAYKLLMGGPMMGVALYTDDIPLLKQNNAILVLAEDNSIKVAEPSSCIRCGRCVKACPMSLVPAAVSAHYENKDFEALRSFNVNTCIECGSCSYVCPAKRPLVQTMRLAKAILKGGK